MSSFALDLPLIIQSRRSANCGPCSVKAVLDYFDIRRPDGSLYSLHSINRLLKTSQKWGCDEENIIELFDRLNLKWKQIEYHEISGSLKSNSPVLTLFQDELHDGHFAVITGETQEEFIFHDPWPDFGINFKRKKENFFKQSKVFDHWLLAFSK